MHQTTTVRSGVEINLALIKTRTFCGAISWSSLKCYLRQLAGTEVGFHMLPRNRLRKKHVKKRTTSPLASPAPQYDVNIKMIVIVGLSAYFHGRPSAQQEVAGTSHLALADAQTEVPETSRRGGAQILCAPTSPRRPTGGK